MWPPTHSVSGKYRVDDGSVVAGYGLVFVRCLAVTSATLTRLGALVGEEEKKQTRDRSRLFLDQCYLSLARATDNRSWCNELHVVQTAQEGK